MVWSIAGGVGEGDASMKRRRASCAGGVYGVCTLSIFRLDFPAGEIAVLSLEAGGRRIRRRPGVVPAPMVWLIAGGAGGEVWGRLDEAAARELRRRGLRR